MCARRGQMRGCAFQYAAANPRSRAPLVCGTTTFVRLKLIEAAQARDSLFSQSPQRGFNVGEFRWR